MEIPTPPQGLAGVGCVKYLPPEEGVVVRECQGDAFWLRAAPPVCGAGGAAMTILGISVEYAWTVQHGQPKPINPGRFASWGLLALHPFSPS